MARKESITRQMILDSAFGLASEKGYREVTARKLANYIGCSTQPIFRVFSGMDELGKEYLQIAIHFFGEYYAKCPYNYEEPFVNLGMAYISFAAKEKNLFELLFLSEIENKPSLYEMLNGAEGNVIREIKKAGAAGCKDAQGLFMKMWIFIHGAACMTITGDYDLKEADTAKLLIETYQAYRNS